MSALAWIVGGIVASWFIPDKLDAYKLLSKQGEKMLFFHLC